MGENEERMEKGAREEGEGKEVKVSLSSSDLILLSPEEETQRDRKKMREEERDGAIHVAHWVGTLFAGLIIATGVLTVTFSVFVVTGQVILPPELESFFAPALAILAIVNIIGGLLLMGRG